ncbi:LuxR C-terminal-related transcriptional regulator [Peribacillus simplex]|uniref:response regulator transcription factor n=1 Tax=Peribacillus simplex TaxID=1478 RepID=UPI002E2255C1|nr:LuxR C-terminal-related transcriptional regulator [Peribacillus simplex]MED3909499.1 LuxR C-terminal-related transcriptional regulator [Peribacillus simplex]
MELKNQITYFSQKVLNSIKNFKFNCETYILIFDKELNVLYSKSNYEKNDLSKLVLEESIENNALVLCSLQNTTVRTKNQISGKEFSVISSPIHEIKNKELQGYVGIITKDDSEEFKMISEMLAIQISYELHVHREKLLIEEIIKTNTSSIITREQQHEVELQIIKNITQGLKDKEIADNLHISVSTVRNYVNKMFEELNITSRSQLISMYYENKLYDILNEIKINNRYF